jgi:predicted enzyme related to lactoylglutathione lyase
MSVETDMAVGTVTLMLDSQDPDALVPFWTEALGYVFLGAVDQYRVLGPGRGMMGPKLLIQGVPEARACKNRMHIDYWVPDQDAERERLEKLGATRVQDEAMEESGYRWYRMQDPDGNEFCIGRSHPLLSGYGHIAL